MLTIHTITIKINIFLIHINIESSINDVIQFIDEMLEDNERKLKNALKKSKTCDE